MVRPDGTGVHQLLSQDGGEQWHPDWSPDGNKIAFIRLTPDDRTELWAVGADGRDSQMLYRCDLPCNELGYPDWSPDGKAIYFGISADPSSDGPPKTFQVGRYDVSTGTTRTVLTRTDGPSAEQPRISPDGSMVAYTRVKEEKDKSIEAALFVADLKGGRERQLTGWDMVAMHPDWTADSRIVFDTHDIMVFQEAAGPANLWIINPDGSHLKALTHYNHKAGDIRASQPRVAPGGSGITFTRLQGSGYGSRQLALIDMDGSKEGWLTPQPITGTHAELRPPA